MTADCPTRASAWEVGRGGVGSWGSGYLLLYIGAYFRPAQTRRGDGQRVLKGATIEQSLSHDSVCVCVCVCLCVCVRVCVVCVCQCVCV
jgi:hypothetical protein